MTAWRHHLTRAAVIPCPLLLLLAACASRTSVRSPTPGSALGAGGTESVAQALEREQQRNGALQQQLDQRAQETERLRSEVQQLRERETQLRTALDDAGGSDAIGSAGSGKRPVGSQNTGTSDATAAGKAANGAMLASLRAALTSEQQRREAAETQLARLKEETSGPAYGETRVPEADYLAVKQEIVDMRKALSDERGAREALAEQLRQLQSAPVPAPAAAEPPAAAEATPNVEDAELRARLQSLQEEKQALVESFNRSLATSQQRTAELEQQLAAAPPPAVVTTAPVAVTDGTADAVRAENAQLKARLDEEHKRTEDLAAKLRVAQRVTDLIFKMQTQQAPGQPKRARRR